MPPLELLWTHRVYREVMLTHLQSPPELPARVVILGAAGFVAGAVERRLRVKESKKYGLKKARKAPQFTKR